MVYFLFEMQQNIYFFPGTLFSTKNGKKTSGKHFFWVSGGLSRRHNGTHQIQMRRRIVKQQSPRLYIPFKYTYG